MIGESWSSIYEGITYTAKICVDCLDEINRRKGKIKSFSYYPFMGRRDITLIEIDDPEQLPLFK